MAEVVVVDLVAKTDKALAEIEELKKEIKKIIKKKIVKKVDQLIINLSNLSPVESYRLKFVFQYYYEILKGYSNK